MITGPVRIIWIEDLAADAELNELELRRAGIQFVARRVETEEQFLRAMEDFHPDVVVADYRLPQFSAMEALAVLKVKDPGLPFILVTGTQSEEVAVDSLKKGADDYILKQSLRRLPSALLHALEKKEAERTKEDAERRLRQTNEELRRLSAHLQSIREEEGARIAREIHDELGQTLTALRLDLAWVRKRLSPVAGEQIAEVRQQVDEMEKLVDTSIQSVRRISTALHPRILDELGLLPALEWQSEEFQNRTGIQCVFAGPRGDLSLGREQETALFRIVQESLTNITRHSGATEVRISLAVRDSRVVLSIEDNGRGISERDRGKLRSIGLVGMRERAGLLGGTFGILGRPAGGTLVTVELPLKKEAKE